MASVEPSRVVTGLLDPSHHLLWLNRFLPIPVVYRDTPTTPFQRITLVSSSSVILDSQGLGLGHSVSIGNTFKTSSFFLVVGSDGLFH